MNTNQTKKAVFLDRDGVLNEEVQYLHRIEDFVWIPQAPAAIRRLNQAGFLTIVVTNQAGVARGFFSENDVNHLHRFIAEQLQPFGANIDAFYYCPYHEEGTVAAYRCKSDLRKPETGMFLRAIDEWHIDPVRSFVVGDKNSDIEPGRRLGIKTILVETGYGAEHKATTNADYIETDLSAAVARILQICNTTPSKTA